MSHTQRKIYSVYFSPTGSSRLAARSVAYALKRELNADIEDIDLTPPAARSVQYRFTDADTVVIAMPVYAGRLPNKIAPDIARCLHGGGQIHAGGGFPHAALLIHDRNNFRHSRFLFLSKFDTLVYTT